MPFLFIMLSALGTGAMLAHHAHAAARDVDLHRDVKDLKAHVTAKLAVASK